MLTPNTHNEMYVTFTSWTQICRENGKLWLNRAIEENNNKETVMSSEIVTSIEDYIEKEQIR